MAMLGGPLTRWTASFALLSVPKAAGPIAFSLLALPLTGDPTSGAAIMTAMTAAQLIGAIPVVRLGQGFNIVSFFRALLIFRSFALAALVALAVLRAPFEWLIVAAATAGIVDGAAFSFLRTILRNLVEDSKVIRALAVGSTLNEVTFVAAPVVASLLSVSSPNLAVLVTVLLGGLPILLIPSVPGLRITAGKSRLSSGSRLASWVWLICTCASGAAVGAIEVGAVALAVNLGLDPQAAILFTVSLCVASVCGGAWISIRNRIFGVPIAAGLIFVMTVGAALVAFEVSITASVIGCVLVGLVMAPLSTFYSVTVEVEAPLERRAEAFALLRTANSMGLVFASAALAWGSLQIGLYLGVSLAAVAFTVLGIARPSTRRIHASSPSSR
jgi:MFS transporter, DHA1 family, inner membrane transport protein